MNEELGIIKNVKFGIRDWGSACIFFSIETLHGSTSWLIRGAKNICDFVEKSQCYELKNMEGKPCVVLVGENQINFVRMLDWPRGDV